MKQLGATVVYAYVATMAVFAVFWKIRDGLAPRPGEDVSEAEPKS